MFKKKNVKPKQINLDQIQQVQKEQQPKHQSKQDNKVEEIQVKKILKPKGLIVGNTIHKHQQIGKKVHEAFDQLNYQSGKNLIKDLNLQEDELQQQKAKRLYLQNVEATRLAKQGKTTNKIYRGMNAYPTHKMTNDDIQNAQGAYKKKMGPSRVNSTIKNTCRFDYVLNLCKDWHDSGYCPFGNSCLYLHDRSNYKTGWQLQKQFEQQQRERWKRINNPDLAQKQDKQKLIKSIEKFKPPSQCKYCNSLFKNPVQVDCGHIFCQKCALKQQKCRQCGKRLSGIMNSADQKLKQKTKSYQQLLLKLQNQEQQKNRSRRKFKDVSGLQVFAD